MDEVHLYFAARYIEQNPVRAKLVKEAEDYRWSSARAHVLKLKDELLSDFDLASSIPDWGAYLREKTCETYIDLLKTHEKSGRPLGSEEFLDELEKRTGRRLKKEKPGRKRRG